MTKTMASNCSRRMKRVLSSREAYVVLDSTGGKGGTWLEGGCALLALALLGDVKGAELVGVFDGGILHHVCLRHGEVLIDGDGLSSSPYAFLIRWRAGELLADPELKAITMDDVQASRVIPCASSDVDQVAKFLRTAGIPALLNQLVRNSRV